MAKFGRPVKFKDLQDLQKKIQAFKDDCKERSVPLTVSRLACFLDCDRVTLLNYESKTPEFFSTIKKIKMEIEAEKHEMLTLGKHNTTGLIFDLKNNANWVDKQEIKQEIDGKMSLIDVLTARDKKKKD